MPTSTTEELTNTTLTGVDLRERDADDTSVPIVSTVLTGTSLSKPDHEIDGEPED